MTTIEPATDGGVVPAAVESRAVLVLGMHRSGTSLLARVLGLLGVELGTDLLPATAANEAGFWEHRQAVALNDDLYQFFDLDWKSAVNLPDRWWEQPKVEPFRARLRDLLHREFGAARAWGVKDPRLCDTLPLWLETLADLRVRPGCALVIRNPVEVARSLERQHAMPAGRAHMLWLRSVVSAERYSRGLPRTLVSYDGLLADWRAAVRRTGDALALDWPTPVESAAAEIDGFVRPQLRHFRADGDDHGLSDPSIPDVVRRVYQAAQRAAVDGRVDDLSPLVDQVWGELADTPPVWADLLAASDAERQTAERIAHQLVVTKADLAAVREQLEAATAEVESQRTLAKQAADTIRDRDVEIAGLHRHIGRHFVERQRLRRRRRRKEAKAAAATGLARGGKAGGPRAKPTVVVIVPFYNGSKFIERAVRSIFEQTVPADEVIVVNDGSRPEERAVLGELAERYPFRILDKENGGQSSARNAGVAASTSEYVCFLDQDDFYLQDHIETLVGGIPDQDARFGWVYADLFEANGDGSIVRTSMVKEHAPHPKKTTIDLLGCDMFVLPSASLVSRSAFLAVDGFDSQFIGYEDDDLFVRLFRRGYNNYYIDRPVTVWCIHTSSASYSIRMSQSRYLYFRKLMELFPDEPEKTRYYFRDCLMPRFGPRFFDDAVDAARTNDPNRPTFNRILRDYADVVTANPSIGWKQKRKMRTAVKFITSAPSAMIRLAETVSTLPLFNRIGWTA